LFTPGSDYLIAESGKQMRQLMAALLGDREAARAMAERGRQTILDRHTCGHRVDELLHIVEQLRRERRGPTRKETRVEMAR
jgi:spore maturation protein CgeB